MREDGFGLIFRGPVPRHSLMVAIVVGTLRNLINQGERLFTVEFDAVKAALTHAVPFFARAMAPMSGPDRGDDRHRHLT